MGCLRRNACIERIELQNIPDTAAKLLLDTVRNCTVSVALKVSVEESTAESWFGDVHQKILQMLSPPEFGLQTLHCIAASNATRAILEHVRALRSNRVFVKLVVFLNKRLAHENSTLENQGGQEPNIQKRENGHRISWNRIFPLFRNHRGQCQGHSRHHFYVSRGTFHSVWFSESSAK